MVGFATCMLAAALLADPPRGKTVPIDLQEKANHALADNFSFQLFEGNDLRDLPVGEQTAEGIKFRIAKRCLALRTRPVDGGQAVNRIDGIEVRREFRKLHVIHAVQNNVAHGREVGCYVLKYEDKTEAKLPLVTGLSVCDWWSPSEGVMPPPRNCVKFWEGTNPAIAQQWPAGRLRLWRSSFDNPHPDKEVIAIDYSSNDATAESSPICIAMTVEL